MSTFFILVRRNIKMFFGDLGMFFSAMITPILLLVLYATFLGNVFKGSFVDSLKDSGITDISDFEGVISGMVNGQLLSSLLSVSCVTVSFCSNMIMVQDKYNGVRRDFTVSPVKGSTLALAYYFGTLIVTLIVTITATLFGFAFIAINGGWFLSFNDVLLVLSDVFLLTVFGTALSSVITFFLNTQGQTSAVGTIVSAGYGFLCGAYMPMASFPDGLQKFLSFLPGTYGTSLIKDHCQRGNLREFVTKFPTDDPEVKAQIDAVVEGIKKGIDCDMYFFGTRVTDLAKYLVLIGAIVLLIAVFVLLGYLGKRKSK